MVKSAKNYLDGGQGRDWQNKRFHWFQKKSVSSNGSEAKSASEMYLKYKGTD